MRSICAERDQRWSFLTTSAFSSGTLFGKPLGRKALERLLPYCEKPDVARDAAARVYQLVTVGRNLQVFQPQPRRFRKVRDFLRFGFTPALCRAGYTPQVLVIEMKIKPPAGWRDERVIIL